MGTQSHAYISNIGVAPRDQLKSMDLKELVTEWPPPQDDEKPACKKIKRFQHSSGVRSDCTTSGSEPCMAAKRAILAEKELQLVCSPVETGLDRLLAKWLKWKRSCGCGSYDELSELPTSTTPSTLLYNLIKYVLVLYVEL